MSGFEWQLPERYFRGGCVKCAVGKCNGPLDDSCSDYNEFLLPDPEEEAEDYCYEETTKPDENTMAVVETIKQSSHNQQVKK